MTAIPETVRTALADRYALEREIGRGGMATVYLARDVKHERRVAVKVLSPPLAQVCCEPDRFVQEIRIAARLTHPSILPLHDSGSADGVPYYVMPYVEGETLRDRLDRGPLPVTEALSIARTLAGAIDYAHRQGVVHRDLKPENVLFQEGAPLLADFGVARAIERAAPAPAATTTGPITERGLAVGTPEYMSPEQAAADSTVDGRSDQYSLAILLYEMLVGEPPFRGITARAVMAQQLVDPAPRVRVRRPEVAVGVDAAIARALSKDPQDRFGTTAAFAEALSAPGPGGPVAGRAVGVAVLPFANLSPDPDAAYLSDGITEELIGALAEVEGLRVASRISVSAVGQKPEDVRAIGARLGVDAVLEGSVRQQGKRLRISARLTSAVDGRTLWAEQYQRELEDVFAIQDEIARTIVATLRAKLVGAVGDPVARRYTDNVKAYSLYLKGRFAWNTRTSEGVADAVKYFEAAVAEDPDYALAYAGLSDAHALHVDYRATPVVEGYERAKAFALKALALDEGLAEAHASLAWVRFIYEWDWDAAQRHFERAIALSPGNATVHQWRSFPLLIRGRVQEGVAAARTAVELDPASPAIRRALGWALYYSRRYEDAAEHLRRGIALNPTAPETFRVLGLVHLQRGAWADAEAAFREAVALAPDGSLSVAGIGMALARAGRVAEARDVLRELEGWAPGRYVSPVAFVVLKTVLGDVDGAFAALEQAYAERRGWLVYLGVEPLMDPLRGDERFAAWLKRLRL